MVRHRIAAFGFLLMTGGMSLAALGQGQQAPATLIAAQRDGMAPLAAIRLSDSLLSFTLLTTGRRSHGRADGQIITFCCSRLQYSSRSL